MSATVEPLFQGLLPWSAGEGAWAVLLCGPVLIASVAGTVFTLRRRSLSPADHVQPADQLFWDLFLGACVALPALLIPSLASPWAGLFLAGAATAAGVGAYRGTPKVLARYSERQEQRRRLAAHQAAEERHDQLMLRWRRYELDPSCSIDFPALTDVRLPETSALIKAMRRADQLRTVPDQGYPDAVGGLAASLAAAERAAGIPAARQANQA